MTACAGGRPGLRALAATAVANPVHFAPLRTMATTATTNDQHHDERARGPQLIELSPAPTAPRPSGAPSGAAENGSAAGRPATIDLASLKPDDRIDGLLACARKAVVDSPDRGLTFLVVVLRDGQRKIQARAFERVEKLAGQFERGDVVHVRGRVATYKGEPQIRLEHIARHKLTPSAEFLPVAYRNLDELDGYLEHLAREVADPGYSGLLDSLLADRELREGWRTAPCTAGGHHAYLGGLLEHTVAVATLALETCALHPRLNGDLLMTAAITHDVGLTRAFIYRAEIADSDAGRMLGHLELGLELLRDHAARVRLPQHAWQRLAHCVLAHHGPRPAFGRTFACPEALALQRLVALDEGVKRALEGGPMA